MIPYYLPQDFLSDVEDFQDQVNNDLDQLKRDNQYYSTQLENLKTKIKDISDKFEEAETASSDVLSKNKKQGVGSLPDGYLQDKIQSEIDNSFNRNASYPLILTSMHSPSQSVGTRASKMLFRKDHQDRYDDDLALNRKSSSENKDIIDEICIDGNRDVQFVFWSPFPFYVYQIAIDYNTTYLPPTAIKMFGVVTKLENEINYNNNIVYTLNNQQNPIYIRFDKPIRFRKLVIKSFNNFGAKSTCIGKVSAYEISTIDSK